MKRSVFNRSNLIVAAIIAGFIFFVWQSLNRRPNLVLEQITAHNPQTLFAGYALHTSFNVGYTPEAMALSENTLYTSSADSLYAYTLQGKQLQTIQTETHIMDIGTSAGKIYVLYPTSVQIYNPAFTLIGRWEACSDNSYFCRLAVAGDKVYITDSDNKLIWRFAANGTMESQIVSPTGFIVPGTQFAITIAADTVYCANPGLHKIERYTLGGKFIDTFGSRGTEEGSFAGCCNPCGMVVTPRGELFTAEKGLARISTFTTSGYYLGTLLSNRQLDNDSRAPIICGQKNTLAVACKNKIALYGKL